MEWQGTPARVDTDLGDAKRIRRGTWTLTIRGQAIPNVALTDLNARNPHAAAITSAATAPSPIDRPWRGTRRLLSYALSTGSIVRSFRVSALGIHSRRRPGRAADRPLAPVLRPTQCGLVGATANRTLLRSGLGMTRHPQRGAVEKPWLPDSNHQSINEIQLSGMLKVSPEQRLVSIWKSLSRRELQLTPISRVKNSSTAVSPQFAVLGFLEKQMTAVETTIWRLSPLWVTCSKLN